MTRKSKRSHAQIAADARRTGRPTLGEKAKKRLVVIRVREVEYRRFQKAAKEAGVSVAAIIMAPHRKTRSSDHGARL